MSRRIGNQNMTLCQNDNETTISTYDATAQAYTDRWFTFRLEKQMRRFTSYLTPGALVLDAGCGPGRDVGYLRELGYRAIGLDRSWGMLSEAQRRVHGPWVCGDLRALPFADGSFDGAWACASLLHLPKADMPRALAELRRVLKGGVLFLALKKGDGEERVMGSDGRCRYFAYYQMPELHDLCLEARFEILEAQTEADAAGRAEVWLNLIARAVGGTPLGLAEG